MAGVELGCLILIVVVPGIISGQWPGDTISDVLSYLLMSWAVLSLGMLIASLFRNAKVAAGFGTVMFFVLQFFAGLWITRASMPDWMRWISDVTPGGAAVQSLQTAALGHWPALGYWGVLLAWGALCTALAIKLFTWE
jgi:ABC-2 type transport system permease protein